MSALLGEFGLYNENNRPISGNTVADGSGNELRIVVDANGFIKTALGVALSYLTDSVKVRGLYSNANVEQFGLSARVNVIVGLEGGITGLPTLVYARTLAGTLRQLLMDDTTQRSLFVSPKVGGVDQLGYSQQPAFINTNQQVITIRDGLGNEIRADRADDRSMQNSDYGMATRALGFVHIVGVGFRAVSGRYTGSEFIPLSCIIDTNGVAQFGYSQQPAFINTNQQVVTNKSSAGVEQYGHQSRVNVVNNEAKTSLAGTVIGDGIKAVTTAGTSETLTAGSVPVKKVWIQADGNNTGDVYVGGSTVDNTRGIHLEIHQTNKAHNILEIEIDDLQKIFIDVANDGDGVTYTYVT